MESKLNVVDGNLHGRQIIYNLDRTIRTIVYYCDGVVTGIIFLDKFEKKFLNLDKMTCFKHSQDFILFTQINEERRTHGEWKLQWKNEDISLSGSRQDGKYSTDGWIFTLKGVQYQVLFDVEKNAWTGNGFSIDEKTFAISCEET